MFTYQHIRKELKSNFLENPFSCTYHWIINWINLEIAKLPQGSKILEIGTFVGGSTQLLAKHNPHVTVHTVDLNDFEENNHMLASLKISHNLPMLTHLDLLELQKMHVEDFSNIVLHTGDSKSLDLDNLSLVFIDGDHTEEGVTADLEFAWGRLIDGGYIFGDDANCFGIYNAFAKFARKHDIELTMYSKGIRIQKTKQMSPNQRSFELPLDQDILVAEPPSTPITNSQID
jgi:hypothetical protein